MALCIGIDDYPEPRDRLGACVADALQWANALASLGFETRLLTNGEATRDAMESAVSQLIAQSRAGDHLVLQYAGHGMSVPDTDGDELDGNDESLCPWDFREGRLWLDDDIERLVRRLPPGVGFTFFSDSCHSETNTRMASMAQPTDGSAPRVRQAVLTRQTLDAHRLDQRARGRTPPAVGVGTSVANRGLGANTSRQRIAKFAACRDDQLAYESAGSGDFTRVAVALLARAVSEGSSNDAFLGRVVARLGAGARQEPRLDCEHALRAAPLLGGGAGRATPVMSTLGGEARPQVADGASDEALRHLVRAIAALTGANP